MKAVLSLLLMLIGGTSVCHAAPGWHMPSPVPSVAPAGPTFAVRIDYLGIEPGNSVRSDAALSEVRALVPAGNLFVETDIPAAVLRSVDYAIEFRIGTRNIPGRIREYGLTAKVRKKMAGGMFVEVFEVEAFSLDARNIIDRDVVEVIEATLQGRRISLSPVTIPQTRSRAWGGPTGSAEVGYVFATSPAEDFASSHLMHLRVSGLVFQFRSPGNPSRRILLKLVEGGGFGYRLQDSHFDMNFASVRIEDGRFFVSTSLVSMEMAASRLLRAAFERWRVLPLTFGVKIIDQPNAYLALGGTLSLMQRLGGKVFDEHGFGTDGPSQEFFNAIQSRVFLQGTWDAGWFRLTGEAYAELDMDFARSHFNPLREVGGSAELTFTGLSGLDGGIGLEPTLVYQIRYRDLTELGYGAALDHQLMIRVTFGAF